MLEDLKRSAYMLRIASKYIEDNDPESIIKYDKADCDGYCVVDDCRAMAEELEGLIRNMESGDG